MQGTLDTLISGHIWFQEFCLLIRAVEKFHLRQLCSSCPFYLVDTAEVIDEQFWNAVIDPKDGNKCAECKEQYKERDYNEWLQYSMYKQWYHNEECFL